jgi:hypothetical protein
MRNCRPKTRKMKRPCTKQQKASMLDWAKELLLKTEELRFEVSSKFKYKETACHKAA